MTPLIIMVGADKGGVGKTTLARALVDYVATRKVTPQVFDTQSPLGDLSRFVPAEVVDIEKVAGQMRVFDAVAGVTLVDVRGGMLSLILRALEEVRLLDDVKAGSVKLALMHVIGPSVASLNEIAETSQLIGAAHYFVVKNHVNEDTFAQWDGDPRYADVFARMATMTIDVPNLKAEAASAVQREGVGFAAFAGNAERSRMLKGYVFAWLTKVFREFDRVGLGDLLAAPAE